MPTTSWPSPTGNVDPADDIKPIGVLPHAAALAATGTLKAAVWYSGHFNIDTLVWDASYATDELKTMAFHGALSPTTILASKAYASWTQRSGSCRPPSMSKSERWRTRGDSAGALAVDARALGDRVQDAKGETEGW